MILVSAAFADYAEMFAPQKQFGSLRKFLLPTKMFQLIVKKGSGPKQFYLEGVLNLEKMR